jgi:hypothetical protein
MRETAHPHDAESERRARSCEGLTRSPYVATHRLRAVSTSLADVAEEALLAEEGADVIDWEELRVRAQRAVPHKAHSRGRGFAVRWVERVRRWREDGSACEAAYDVLDGERPVGDRHGSHRPA